MSDLVYLDELEHRQLEKRTEFTSKYHILKNKEEIHITRNKLKVYDFTKSFIPNEDLQNNNETVESPSYHFSKLLIFYNFVIKMSFPCLRPLN